MRIERKEVQPREVVVESYYLCDKCGKRIQREYTDAFEFDLEHKTGTIGLGGGCGEVERLDLCAECAPQAIKLLIENGFQVQSNEWSV